MPSNKAPFIQILITDDTAKASSSVSSVSSSSTTSLVQIIQPLPGIVIPSCFGYITAELAIARDLDTVNSLLVEGYTTPVVTICAGQHYAFPLNEVSLDNFFTFEIQANSSGNCSMQDWVGDGSGGYIMRWNTEGQVDPKITVIETNSNKNWLVIRNDELTSQDISLTMYMAGS